MVLLLDIEFAFVHGINHKGDLAGILIFIADELQKLQAVPDSLSTNIVADRILGIVLQAKIFGVPIDILLGGGMVFIRAIQ